MRIRDALPEIFKRPVPVVSEGTSILVAGTLLDTPRRDLLPIVRQSNKSLQYLLDDRKYLKAFGGHAILSRLVETKPSNYHDFLFDRIETIAVKIRPIPAGEEITTLLSEFSKIKFGWSVIDDRGVYALATLSDLIPLYAKGLMETNLRVKDVATKVFSLPGNTRLRDALSEMLRRYIRRVFISGTGNFVSDREILSFIFSPKTLALIRDSPKELLESRLEEIPSIQPVVIESNTTLREASELFKPLSGAWCLAYKENVVTPWDLIMKPWKMGRLKINEAIEVDQPAKKIRRRPAE